MDTAYSPPACHVPAAPRGITRFTVVRFLLAVLAVCVPVAAVLILSNQIDDKALRAYWPPLLAALLGCGGYVLYVRRIERRAVTELSGPRAWRELGSGVAAGALLFCAALAVIAVWGSYTVGATGSWTTLVRSSTEMVFVALIEEILFRAVLFRLIERSLGAWPALVISSVIFALAHLPNDSVTLLAIANTAVAGMMLTAAYLATRRVWFTAGVHFAWNFLGDGVFSVPTSGNPARGLLQGQLTGPEWLTGGLYGLEGSAVSFAVLALATILLLRYARRAGMLAPRAAAEGNA